MRFLLVFLFVFVVVRCSTVLAGTVVTSFYPMQIMVINILKDVPDIKIVNMTPPQTGCLHDYQLTPSDVKTLEHAAVFIVNGAGMEHFIGKVTSLYPKLNLITASDGIKLIKDRKLDKSEEYNPHVWVSISLAIKQVGNIGGKLQKLFPVHSERIDGNTKRYISSLEKLNKQMHERLKNIRSRNIVTFHEAFPYFAQEFNLNIVGVVEREPGSEPSAMELRKLIEEIRGYKIKALFAEPQYPVKAAQTISKETGSTVYYLDPAVTGSVEPDAYINIMQKNLLTMEEALR